MVDADAHDDVVVMAKQLVRVGQLGGAAVTVGATQLRSSSPRKTVPSLFGDRGTANWTEYGVIVVHAVDAQVGPPVARLSVGAVAIDM